MMYPHNLNQTGQTKGQRTTIPTGTFHGGDQIPAGTFHGGDEIPAGTFHAGN